MKKQINFFYLIKPFIPRRIQISLRRAIAVRKRKANKDIWPINPKAAKTPECWSGWPENKNFALTLSHDVDTVKGYNKCIELMKLEENLGFRSSFNFVPEDYQVSDRLRLNLAEAGFEVGVHGLKHDGKLFSSRRIFEKSASRINHYLKEWEAVGFRAPSMHKNLEWITELDIEYDSSTFDTDPFEPQPDGVESIFPFWITNKSLSRGYVELPSTLPQDHCLFVILKEKDIRIWKEKLDWIAQNGGLAFLNTHPDYMNFNGSSNSLEQYPVSYYTDLLEYVKTKYSGQYWHVLPRELVRFWKSSHLDVDSLLSQEAQDTKPKTQKLSSQPRQTIRISGIKIWIDLDNTPHVPFFVPIIHELERRGHKVVLTARDAFQVCELADEKGLHYTKIGHHYGKNKIMKIFGLLWRSVQLAPFYYRHRPRLAFTLGSRSLLLFCKLLRIPTIHVFDYEHARHIRSSRSDWKIIPEALSGNKIYSMNNRIRYYRGIKEDVYVPEFKPDPSLLEDLGLHESEIIVTVRPPANEAHYHNPEGDKLFLELMSRICMMPGIRVVLLPRHRRQELAFKKNHPEWFTDNRTIVPPRVVNGLNLLWFSDLASSGGGTMNREASAMGVPVYSIFRGKIGAVDRMLEQEGRLTMIKSCEEVWTKIRFIRRDKSKLLDYQKQTTLEDILKHVEEIIRIERVRPYKRVKVSSS